MTTASVSGRKGLRTTLFVGNLPDSLSAGQQEAELRRAFEAYGPCTECEVLREDDGSSRGFAFVRLESGVATGQAKVKLDGTLLGGSPSAPIKVRWALDTSTLCVCDLGPDVNHEMLQQSFHQFGSVVHCWIEKDPAELGGGSRCRAFVEYSKRTTAAKVQQLLSQNLFLLGSSPRPVRVEFALDDAVDDNEGQPVVDRSQPEPPPHFAQPGSLEFDFALKWRELSLAHKAEEDRLAELHRQEREVLRLEQRALYEAELAKWKTLDSRAPTNIQGLDLGPEAGAKRPRY